MATLHCSAYTVVLDSQQIETYAQRHKLTVCATCNMLQVTFKFRTFPEANGKYNRTIIYNMVYVEPS